MIVLEFDIDWNCGFNRVAYKHEMDPQWNYMYVNMETLALLLHHYGVVSTKHLPGKKYVNLDNGTTGRQIQMKFCGADIMIECKGKYNYNEGMFSLMKIK